MTLRLYGQTMDDDGGRQELKSFDRTLTSVIFYRFFRSNQEKLELRGQLREAWSTGGRGVRRTQTRRFLSFRRKVSFVQRDRRYA